MDPLIDFLTSWPADTWEALRFLSWLVRLALPHVLRGLPRAYCGRAGNQPRRTTYTTGGQRRHQTIHLLLVIS